MDLNDVEMSFHNDLKAHQDPDLMRLFSDLLNHILFRGGSFQLFFVLFDLPILLGEVFSFQSSSIYPFEINLQLKHNLVIHNNYEAF